MLAMASLLIKNRQEATQRVMSQKIKLNLTQPLSIKNLSDDKFSDDEFL